jgi:hypothetical protein
MLQAINYINYQSVYLYNFRKYGFHYLTIITNRPKVSRRSYFSTNLLLCS